MKTLLSIDGGGLFGVGVANWIPKLKNWKFDYYAGTSVGSILAACYAFGIEPLRPATYDNAEAKKVLKEVFGDAKIKDAKFPLIIVAWNYDKKKEKVFTNKFNSDYLLRDAVLASMSAPTYFPILKLKDEEGIEEQLGDGGVCGNDPSLAGISAMRDDGMKTKDIKCLSVKSDPHSLVR